MIAVMPMMNECRDLDLDLNCKNIPQPNRQLCPSIGSHSTCDVSHQQIQRAGRGRKYSIVGPHISSPDEWIGQGQESTNDCGLSLFNESRVLNGKNVYFLGK
jgi:hypothetical protein